MTLGKSRCAKRFVWWIARGYARETGTGSGYTIRGNAAAVLFYLAIYGACAYNILATTCACKLSNEVIVAFAWWLRSDERRQSSRACVQLEVGHL
jgi:hypothetical protein